MPYAIFKTGSDDKPFCVHKEDTDGEPVGKPLGCHASRESAEEQLSALYANEKSKTVVHLNWAATKLAGDWELEVLGVPFGGPNNGKDADGEFFSERSDLMIKIGDKRPVIYNHGADPDNKKELMPMVIGEAEYVRKDAKGHWFKVRLDKASEYAAKIMESAKQGLARASSGAVNYLTRILKTTGEILVWPFSELTLIDYVPGKREPANDFAVARLKTIYEQANIQLPEAFVQGGEPETDAAKGDCGCSTKGLPPTTHDYILEARKWLQEGTTDGN